MDASVTFRLPTLTIASREGNTTPTVEEPPITESGPSDEALMAQICKGSREALAVLFRRYARTVRRVAYRVLRDPAEADDLLQDVFLLVHHDCTKFDGSKGPLRFWLLQMTHRRAISRRRYLNSRHFYARPDLGAVGTELLAPENNALNRDSIDSVLGTGLLQKAFETLSEDQRRTLRLFFVDGYTLDEIAAKLGQSRGNVKHHYFRGLERLRKGLFGSKLPGERAI